MWVFREIFNVFFIFRYILPVLNLYVVKRSVRCGDMRPAIFRLHALHFLWGCCPTTNQPHVQHPEIRKSVSFSF